MTHTADPSEATATSEASDASDPGRRAVLGGLAAAAALTAAQWTPLSRIPVGGAEATVPPPPGPPPGIAVYQQSYRNWSGELRVDDLWTCAPATPADVVILANWAKAHGWTLRAKGHSHNWSPILVTADAGSAATLLVDTTQNLTSIAVQTGATPSVTAQAGVSMDVLLATLEASGYGLTAVPAPGDITLGGVLAIDAHGTAVPAVGETRPYGHTYGSISNLVLSLTAVVWDAPTAQYRLRTFQRTDPAIAPLLVSLGRGFVVEATLRVGQNQRLRCQSWMTVSADDIFAPPATAGANSFASYVNQSGRVEVIWFPFTDNPWVKLWTVAPTKPPLSRQVTAPYNYPFSDFLPTEAADLLGQIIAGNSGLTPAFCNLQGATSSAGLLATLSWDLWGWSKNTMLYIRPTTFRVTANGYAILTKRADIQRVVSEFHAYYKGALASYQAQGRFPMNGPLEVRVTGLDDPGHTGVAGAVHPTLSALRTRPDHPEWDVAVWLDILTTPGTPYSGQFYRETEQWVLANYSGSYPQVRVEWSKGWGYSGTAAWSDPTTVGTTVPDSFRSGLPAGNNWDTGVAALDAYDPHRVFTNPFLDTLLT
ncbi:cholesterol oxidase substrate-binding domain-containing protein [Streptodolium elevatio]